MRVDVHGFVVQVEQALEAAHVGVGGWPVVGQDVVVVLLPWRELGEFEEEMAGRWTRVGDGWDGVFEEGVQGWARGRLGAGVDGATGS